MDLLRDHHAERLMPTAGCHSELRLAAARMRERAEAATPGPWEGGYDDSGRPFWIVNTAATGDQVAMHDVADLWDYDEPHGKEGADAEHIASWHPVVALAVAAWLVDTAPLMRCDDCGMAEFHCLESRGIKCCPDCGHGRKALSVARAYLGSTDA